ncbi:1107_t:CDS:2 [Gigaspora margarita]|uniref:1107_t:CDS:1 n=1 Tax=Gigaspora margarita TaxID=4874 RepID=A0ABN7UT40_GIGMA|nr:1107_t:CDS:2 [Gigaspora margarita]
MHFKDKQRENTRCPPQSCIGISIENDQDQNEFVAEWEERTTKQSRNAAWVQVDEDENLAIEQGQEIESQVSQILWNSLEQNLQRKISLEKLTSWLYGETQNQKEAIREEIIRNLTRKKTEKTFYKACGKNNTVQQVLIL